MKLGGVATRNFFINQAGNEISALTSAREEAGTVDVALGTLDGATSALTKADHYKYLPVITRLSTSGGP